MSKVQTEDWSVDREGRRLVNPASRCALKTRSTVALSPAGTKTPLGRFLRRRSMLLIKNHVQSGFGVVLSVGGDGVDSTTSYPLPPGVSIRLPVTVRVLINVVGATQDSSARQLEHG